MKAIVSPHSGHAALEAIRPPIGIAAACSAPTFRLLSRRRGGFRSPRLEFYPPVLFKGNEGREAAPPESFVYRAAGSAAGAALFSALSSLVKAT